MPSDSAVVKTYVIGQFTGGGGGGGGGTPYNNTPSMDGIGSPGSSTKYARGDHRHPSDSSKANVADVPSPSNVSPDMDGTASAGSSAAYARGDHRHPSDTSKADVSALAQKANISDVPASASISEIGLISFKNGSGTTLFTLQLPLYDGETSDPDSFRTRAVRFSGLMLEDSDIISEIIV